jgi:hypothetical protein
MSKPGLSRREALRSLTVGGIAAAAAPLWVETLGALAHAHAETHPQAPSAAADWSPKVLSVHQDETVATISELIIPQTETPGAKAALVNRFVDAVLDAAEASDRKSFLRGLDWVDARSAELFGSTFVDAAPEQQVALLTIVSSPKNRALEDQIGVELFQAIKSMTITGYYTSEIGMKQELGDDGNLFFAEFKGCTHPEHGAPPSAAKPARKG